jgi:hypothetical protein
MANMVGEETVKELVEKEKSAEEEDSATAAGLGVVKIKEDMVVVELRLASKSTSFMKLCSCYLTNSGRWQNPGPEIISVRSERAIETAPLTSILKIAGPIPSRLLRGEAPIIRPTPTPLKESSPIASEPMLNISSAAGDIPGLVIKDTKRMEPFQVAERRKAEIPASKSNDMENEESWSSVEELEPGRPLLDTKAREQTELTIETFWDVFNKHGVKLFRQRAAAGQQGPSSAASSQSSVKKTASLSTTSSISQLYGNIHSRADDDEDDWRFPKRIRSELELPADRIENPRYSCPYRKHNRQRYNIHTHRTCALSWFLTIARLK